MKVNERLIFAVLELIIILCLTGITFELGRAFALAERGYKACGGEYLILALPALYYAGKRTVKDWLGDLREIRRGGNPWRKEE